MIYIRTIPEVWRPDITNTSWPLHTTLWGEGVSNTANSKANDRTLMQFIPLSPSILGVCRRSKYARWRDTIDEDDPWIWGLSSMIKSSAAPDYIYHAAMVRNLRGGWRLVYFSFRHNYLSVSAKKIFFRVESAPSTQDCDDPSKTQRTWCMHHNPSRLVMDSWNQAQAREN